MNSKDLQSSFDAWKNANLPPRTRVEVDVGGRVELFCSGRIPWQAYICGLAPGHTGKCLCKYKGGLEFAPEIY